MQYCKGTAPELYIPPEQDIENLLKDPSLPIGLVEVEKKALKATKEFELTFGLGGIWNFRSKRLYVFRASRVRAFSNLSASALYRAALSVKLCRMRGLSWPAASRSACAIATRQAIAAACSSSLVSVMSGTL
jgi:hypothetical protein